MVLIGLLFSQANFSIDGSARKKSPSKCSVTFSSPNPTLKILFTRLMPDWFLAKISIMLWLLWCERILLLLLHDLVANTSRERGVVIVAYWIRKIRNDWAKTGIFSSLWPKPKDCKTKYAICIMQFLAKITCYTLRGKWNKDQKDGF